LIALELTPEQRAAADAAFDGCFAILGAPASGKSTALRERVMRARALHPQAALLTIGSPRELGELAAELLRERGVTVRLIDDADAERLFTDACEPLFEMKWEELAREQLDPEVPGLRSPERFMQSAFRLIRRLGDAHVDPARFLSLALSGATEFYASPPNFTDPSLLIGTKNTFHDSLDVDPPELARQYRREVDLAKILARLYTDYVQLVSESGCMTGRDAIVAASDLVSQDPEFAACLRARYRLAFVDEAQELTAVGVALLRAIFGDGLAGVTLCGDPSAAVSLGTRTQPEAIFKLASARVTLPQRHRSPRLDLQRLSTAPQEAEFVAERVGEWIAQGVPPERIAVIFRSVRNVEIYENALLDRNIPVLVSGDANLFEDRRALDALALLWNVYDPFAHEWLLRTLSGPTLGLSDASLAILCGEPSDPQRPLFTFDDEPAPTARTGRWNSKRDLRLGWNLIRGEVDDLLTPDALERIARFRAMRKRWVEMMDASPLEDFARGVWRDALAREGEPDSARALAQQAVLRRLLTRLTASACESEDRTTSDVLEYAQQRMESELEGAEPFFLRQAQDDRQTGQGPVHMLSVEAARGCEFERVVVANVRPGAFPLWYAPDAFLFSPKLGMIPKENSGEARASRTAKFSYYMFASKAARHYNDGERLALHYAMRRARNDVLVTAWGTPTRGITAPELLEELR
jgi:superfamily I DNA/RNA helicase